MGGGGGGGGGGGQRVGWGGNRVKGRLVGRRGRSIELECLISTYTPHIHSMMFCCK